MRLISLPSVLSPKHDNSADADLASQRCLALLNEFTGGGGDGSASTAESTATSERPPSPKSKQKSRRRLRRRRKEESDNVDSGNDDAPPSPRKRNDKRRRHRRLKSRCDDDSKRDDKDRRSSSKSRSNAPPSPRTRHDKRRRHRRSKSRRDDNNKRDDKNRRSSSKSRRREMSLSRDAIHHVVEEDTAIAKDFETMYRALPPVEAARQMMVYLQEIRTQEHQEQESAIYLDPDDVSVVSSLSGFDSIHSGALTVCSTSIGEDSISANNRPPIVVDVAKNDISLESLIDDDDDFVLYFD